MSAPAEVCYYGPCGTCGLVHGGWEACPDGLTASGRIAEIRRVVERVSARGHITAGLDVADLATVLLLCAPIITDAQSDRAEAAG